MFRIGITAVLAAMSTAAQAQDCAPIRFDPGASGASVTGTLPAEGQDCFTLDVRPGQNVVIALDGADPNVAMSVIGVGDAREAFDFAAPSGRVEFLVFQLMRSVTDADYRLRVEVR